MNVKWSPDDAKIIREMIWKEGEFINHRVTWLVTLQGLLFTALGFAQQHVEFPLITPLAVIGIVTSATSFVGLWFARMAVVKLKSDWETFKPEDYRGPDVIGYFCNPRLAILLPWLVLPVLFSSIWIWLFIKLASQEAHFK